MSKLIIHFKNKHIQWHDIKFNALRDQSRKVCEPQLEKHSLRGLKCIKGTCPSHFPVSPHYLLYLSFIPDLLVLFSFTDIHCSF